MRFSLRRKLAGGFGLLLGLIALLGWVTFSLFASLRTVQREVFDDAVPGLVAADELVRSYTAQSAAVRGYLIVSQPRLLQQYRQEVAEAARWRGAAERLFTEEAQRRLLGRLVLAGRAYQRLVDGRVIPLAQRGERALAFRLLGQEGAPLISNIESLGVELRAAQDEVVEAAEAELRTRSNQALAILFVVVVGALVAGSGLAVALPRALVRNLARLVDAARKVGQGNLDQRLDIRSGDEIEELAARFTEMQAGLKRLQQLALQDRELEIAASIQQNLVQRVLPTTPEIDVAAIHRQANVVGGDWYDVELKDGVLSVVVADASGKGIGAALMATVALSVLRSERSLGAAPRQAVRRVNEALREASASESFTTLLYVAIELATGQARALNMGHPPPFVLPASAEGAPNRARYLEGPRNRALGWWEEPGAAEAVFRLQPGDRLLLFTDGCLDAKSPSGEALGEHRFGQWALEHASSTAESLGRELLNRVEEHAAGKLDDDLTMIVVEFQGAALDPALTRTLGGEEPWDRTR